MFSCLKNVDITVFLLYFKMKTLDIKNEKKYKKYT